MHGRSHSASDEMIHVGFVAFPVPPEKTSQLGFDPPVEFLEDPFGLRKAEVVGPAADQWVEVLKDEHFQVSAAGRFNDVISLNYYVLNPDVSFLERISQNAGNKPLIIGEFSFGAKGRAHPNGGIVDVASQQDRGTAYRHYVETMAGTGKVLGVGWFSYLDQSANCRFFDTEAFNDGLVDITDRPYRSLVEKCTKVNRGIYEVLSLKRRP